MSGELASAAAWLNELPEERARQELTRCCGASRWVEGMLARRPFGSGAQLVDSAASVWATMGPTDWLEAFSHHPRIGERRVEVMAAAGTAEWSRGEQAGAAEAEAEVQRLLAEGNARYEECFGHVFLIRAAGRSGEEMLAELERRLGNTPEAELAEAADQQLEITKLRLAKLAPTSDETHS